MRFNRNYDRIIQPDKTAGGTRWLGLPEKAAGSPLRQVTVVDTEARAEAGALNYSGDGPGGAWCHHLCVAPPGAALSGVGSGWDGAWSGGGAVIVPRFSAASSSSGCLLDNPVIVEIEFQAKTNLLPQG